ncbi:GGDEF domain-containing protein [Kordiimonas pumila]|uniref:diguanylate cyclase n=1 Tax=Kordiimonas pumila TaxID=2161677 RepID=A0ABV7D125_9PROT|nr:GGDEF domain-containing protein [Kordiimonas pumila]
MSFSDKKDDANVWAKQAFDLMDNHDIPAAPPNYEIWYNYASERYPELQRTLDQMITKNQRFEGHVNSELYNKFIGTSAETALIQKTGTQLQGQLATVLQALGVSSDQINGCNTSIRDSVSTYEKDMGPGSLQSFVQQVVMQTKLIQQSNESLQDKLERSSAEIKALQESLIQIEAEVYSDGLTGIANRKKFDAFLVTAIADAEDTGKPLCLVFADIDFFKQFNDTFGHQVGDQVLKLVAGTLHANVKGHDLAARYGGEEFALVLPDTTLEGAYRLVEKIRDVIATRTIRNRQKNIDYGQVTISLGIACYRGGEDVADLIDRADKALYTAKDQGRNRAVTEDSC